MAVKLRAREPPEQPGPLEPMVEPDLTPMEIWLDDLVGFVVDHPYEVTQT